MANPDHLEIFNKGVGEWNKWRHENPDIEPDLSELELNGITIPGWREPFVLSPNLTVFRANKNRYGILKMAVPALVNVEDLTIEDIESVKRELYDQPPANFERKRF